MEKPDKDDEALQMKARLDRLSSALEAKNKSISSASDSSDPVAGGNIGRTMSLGFRVLSEFVAGIIVGCLMGWQFDEWFSTSPLFLILFLALGTAAGFWNVYRIAAAPTQPGKTDQ
jgi:ATP synthase protein I